MSTRAKLLTAVLATATLSLTACGNDSIECGPGDAPANGATVTVNGDTVSFDRWTSSPNNDCSEAGHPTSLTLDGIQVGGAFHMTFCMPRPDELGGVTNLSDSFLIQVISVSAQVNGCNVIMDSQATATGTIDITGYCSDGLNSDGYAVELDGSIPGTQTCGGVDTPVTMELGGRVSVEALSN